MADGQAITPTGPTLAPGQYRSSKQSFARHRWHVENVHPFVDDTREFDDIPRLFEQHMLPGHSPAAPILKESDPVITLGSCFAIELREFLDEAEFSSETFYVPPGLNNSFALLDFISWCTTGESTGRGYRYERDNDGSIREWTPEAERADYERQFRAAGCFVFTLGLAEVWEDRDTGRVFWRGVPEEIFDADRHVFRLSSVSENTENITRIIELLRTVNTTAPIVLTLSPVPLQATFREIPCISADAVSKSVLRVALDNVMSAAPPNVYYWPSFELVRWVGGMYDHRSCIPSSTRHPERHIVYTIVRTFVKVFYGEAAAATFARRLELKGLVARRPNRVRDAVRSTRFYSIGVLRGLKRRGRAGLRV